MNPDEMRARDAGSHPTKLPRSDSFVNEMRARHRWVEGYGSELDGVFRPHCAGCDRPWPCDTARLLALLTPESVAAALDRQVLSNHGYLSVEADWQFHQHGWLTAQGRRDALLARADALLAELTK